MGVRGKLFYKNGEERRIDKPCFGFMSYLDRTEMSRPNEANDWLQAHPGDRWSNDHVIGAPGIDRFEWEPSDIRHSFGIDGVTRTVLSYAIEVVDACPELFPDMVLDKRTGKVTITLNPETSMQETILCAMMLRNFTSGTAGIAVYNGFRNRGLGIKESYLLSQLGYKSSNWDGTELIYYRPDGDSAIFTCRGSRMCDLVSVLLDGFQNLWQGGWGTTRNGYGRYGRHGTSYLNGSEFIAPEDRRLTKPTTATIYQTLTTASYVLIDEVYNQSTSMGRRLTANSDGEMLDLDKVVADFDAELARYYQQAELRRAFAEFQAERSESEKLDPRLS